MPDQNWFDNLPDGVKKGWNFLLYLWRGFSNDNCQTVAAALTYQTLFAVVPALTVSYAFLDLFQAFEALGLKSEVESFLFDNVIPENVHIVQQYLLSFSQQARNLSGPSLVLLAVTAFLMLYTIEKTFNEIWRVGEPRHGFQRFLVYWSVFTLGPPIMGLSIVITTYITSLPFISDVTQGFGFLRLVPLVLSTGMLTLIYTVVPNCVVPVKYAFIGGLVTAIVFELAKVIFTLIVGMSNFEVIYGTFAAVPLFLLWIYVSWTIILVGAELVKSLAFYRFVDDFEIDEPLFQMLVILEVFYMAHQQGDTVDERDVRKLNRRIDLELWPEIKSRLLSMHLIRAVDGGGLVLAKDLNEVSTWDLYEATPWQLPPSVHGHKAWEQKLGSLFEKLYEERKVSLSDDLETLFKNS